MNPQLEPDYIASWEIRQLISLYWPFDRSAWGQAWNGVKDGDQNGRPKNKRQATRLWKGNGHWGLKDLPWWDRIPYFLILTNRCRS